MDSGRAAHLAERAVSDIYDGRDAIPRLSAAIAQLRIDAGELDPAELAEYACDCGDDICPFDTESAEAI